MESGRRTCHRPVPRHLLGVITAALSISLFNLFECHHCILLFFVLMCTISCGKIYIASLLEKYDYTVHYIRCRRLCSSFHRRIRPAVVATLDASEPCLCRGDT